MLPKEYLGSFDMVVVDLSETAMSLTVRDKLDVIEALNEMLSSDAFIDIKKLRNVRRKWVHVQYNNCFFIKQSYMYFIPSCVSFFSLAYSDGLKMDSSSTKHTRQIDHISLPKPLP